MLTRRSALFTLHWWGAYSPWRPTRRIWARLPLLLLLFLFGASSAPLVARARLGKIETVREPGRATVTTHRRRRLSLGLRARVTVAFAIVGLVVAVSLSIITYSLARSFLLQQRDSAARSQAFNNARFVKERLRDPKVDVGRAINDVRTEGGGFAVVHYNGHWYPQSAGLGQDQLPKSLLDAVLLGNSGRQRYDRSGDPYLAIGLYVAANDAANTASYNALQQKSAEAVGSAKYIAQFLDRDTDPDFAANVVGQALADFIASPGDIDGILADVEAKKQTYTFE